MCGGWNFELENRVKRHPHTQTQFTILGARNSLGNLSSPSGRVWHWDLPFCCKNPTPGPHIVRRNSLAFEKTSASPTTPPVRPNRNHKIPYQYHPIPSHPNTIPIPSQYHIILYHTILYHTILYYTIPYYTILYHTILYYTILYYTILYYTILYCTILYYTILYYSILYYTILYCTILYCSILYYTTLY